MRRSLHGTEIGRAYQALAARWCSLDDGHRRVLIDDFAVDFAYHSGALENERITLQGMREVFDCGEVSSHALDAQAMHEMENLKSMWSWTTDTLASGFSFDVEELLFCHVTLTRVAPMIDAVCLWGSGRGEFKHHMYEVADGVGDLPEDVPLAVESTLAEVREALSLSRDELGSLSVAAYLHATLVDIHPFADGNGRVARQLATMVLLSECLPPVLYPEPDRMAYFGALDAYHAEDELDPLRQFMAVETIRYWDSLIRA